MISPGPEFYADPFGGKGILVGDSPTKREWVCEVEPGKWAVMSTEWVDPLFEQNAALKSINRGKKWGDGRVVASIPESVFYRGDFKKAFDGGDQQWLKRFLNDSSNEKLRTFEGKV